MAGFVTVTNSLYSNNADFKVRARDDGSSNYIQNVDTKVFDIITKEWTVLDADGAQTDKQLITATGTERITVFRCTVTPHPDNTVKVAVRVGFGATVLPAASLSGATGIISNHPGIFAGSGIIENLATGLGRGAAGESVRMTSSDPVTGSFTIVISYILEAS